jgi:hypothetical protein
MTDTNRASFRIDAAYAVLVQPFQSRDPTRFYLEGFYVQPGTDGGATIVATDGHTMAIFKDKAGTVKVPGIIKLSKTTLAACKSYKTEIGRVLVVDGERASVYFNWNSEEDPGILVAAQDGAVIDGTFPDWRRVVPSLPVKFGPATVNGSYLKRFERMSNHGKPTAVSVFADNQAGPVIVLTEREDFVGIVMPMRGGRDSLPAWL